MLVGGLCIRKEARKAPVLGGGGSVGLQAARTSAGANVLVSRPCIRSRLGIAVLNVDATNPKSPEMLPMNAGAPTFGFTEGALQLRFGTRQSAPSGHLGRPPRAGGARPDRGSARDGRT